MKIYEDLTFQDAEDNDVKRGECQHRQGTPHGNHAEVWVEGAKQF